MNKIILILIAASALLTSKAFAKQPPTVEILAVTCTNTVMGPEVEGEVKNLSSGSLGQIYMDAVFRQANGKFVSATQSVLVDFDPLLAGQASPFEGYGDDNPAIAYVEVTPALMSAGSLTFSGNNKAICR